MEKEQVIKMTARLYECRDTAKRFYNERYQEKIGPYKQLITAVMKANKCSELEAIIRLSETETYRESPMGQILFMAAAVELMEPSKTETPNG